MAGQGRAVLRGGVIDEWDERTFDWMDFAAEPDWERCRACADLLGYCDSAAQRSFLLSWWRTQHATGLGEAYARWSDWLRRVAESRECTVRDTVASAGGPYAFVGKLAELALGFPALVPEVWLNYVGPERTLADEEHLRENPQRVDFVMLSEGRKCVIEIDGPSHYATYDEDASTYSVSEGRYAKNLKIERSLRRQGWEIHRFANVEVRDVPDDDFIALVEHLPGYATDSFFGRDVVTAEKLRTAMGDAERYLAPA